MVDGLGGRDRLSQRLEVGRVADQFDQSGLVCAGYGEGMDGTTGKRAGGSQNAPQGRWSLSRRPLDLSSGPDWAFTGRGWLAPCVDHVSPSQRWRGGGGSTFWAHHSLRQAGPAFLPDHLSHHLCRPAQGRVDRMVPLSLRPGDLRLLSDTLILPDPQVTEAPGSGSH